MGNQVEIWKSNPEIEKIEVSSFGRVRSVKGHYYKSCPNNCGYLQVTFSVNGKNVYKLVHRLVAQTFIPNPDNLPEVNHKDCDRKNNSADNLEWCSHEENIAYRERFGKAQNRPVFAINLATLEVSQFCSQNEAGRTLGVNIGNINSVIKGKLKTTGGYWFLNDDGHAVDVINQKLHDIGKTGLKI